jgi:cobalt-zinc-cadmium efflux system membrane fusion protein
VRFKTKDTARLAGLRFAEAVEQSVSREVIATARVVYDAARVAQVNPRMAGVVRAIRADVGAVVKEGAPLAILESAGVGAEQSRLQAARMRLEVADTNHKRVESLRAEGISTERDLLAARREREDARAEMRATQAALAMVGASAEGGARYTITAPIAGVVTQRNATLGRLIDGEDIAFEVVDPSAMWVELDVPEGDLPLVAVGQRVSVALDGLPGRDFTGTLTYVAPSVDPRSRTSIARVPLQNVDGALRANLFGRARIVVTDPRASVLVPRMAVQRARAVNLTFVRLAEDVFEARRVTVGAATGELVAVAGRIKAGDEVVTDGSYLLKTETLKESIGAGCCEVD